MTFLRVLSFCGIISYLILLSGCVSSPFVKTAKEECGPLYTPNASALDDNLTVGGMELLEKILKIYAENAEPENSYNFFFRGQSFDYVECMARHDDQEAQYVTGMFYLRGDKVAQDYKKAAHWFKKASKYDSGYDNMFISDGAGGGMLLTNKTRLEYKGHTGAMYRLGLMYLEGLGVDQSNSKARKYFKKAAKHGSVRAKRKLEEMGEI